MRFAESAVNSLLRPAPWLSVYALALLGADADAQIVNGPICDWSPAAVTGGRGPGLIVGADMLLPDGHRPDYGVHIRFNGGIGAVADFEAVRDAYPEAAVLDCRGRAVASPGFVNAHEHAAFSYAFPDPNLNPGYAHRDEWRLGLAGKVQLPSPQPHYYEPGDPESTAILVAVELRHLLGGATAIAGTGGVPGVIRNINRHVREGDPALYDAEADVSTFPFSVRVVEDLADECAGGPAHRFPPPDGELAFMAYVPHVGRRQALELRGAGGGGPLSRTRAAARPALFPGTRGGRGSRRLRCDARIRRHARVVGLEPPPGAVQELLLPGNRNHFDTPAGLAELLPKAAVGLSPGVQLRAGSHAGVDVDKDGRLRANGNRRLEGEVMDQPLGMAGVDPAGQQVALEPELLKAGDLLLFGRQPGQPADPPVEPFGGPCPSKQVRGSPR